MASYFKSSTLEKSIQKQVRLWEQSLKVLETRTEVPRPFLTISREYGCNATETACVLEDELNNYENTDVWRYYDRDLLKKIEEDHKVSQMLIETIDTRRREEINEFWRSVLTGYPPQVSVYQKLVRTIRSLSIHGRAIIIGRAGVEITRSLKYGIHLKLVAPLNYRIQKIMELNKIRNRLEAEKIVAKKDQERHDFLTQYVKFDARNPAMYDITFNIARVSPVEISQSVICILRSKGFFK